MHVSSFTYSYLAISAGDADDFNVDDDDDHYDCHSLKPNFLALKHLLVSRRKQGLKEYR
jgi:hypothetical protein